MKITKPGKVIKVQEPTFYGKCCCCGCEFETDIYDKAILPYARSNPILNCWCPTPNCGKLVTLTETKE